VWKTFLERKEEDQRVQQAEQELVSGYLIVLICAECALVAAGEGSDRGSSRTGEEVRNSATGA